MSEPQAQPNAAQSNGAGPVDEVAQRQKFAAMLAGSDDSDGAPDADEAPTPAAPEPKPKAAPKAQEADEVVDDDQPTDTGLVRQLRQANRATKRKYYERDQARQAEVSAQLAEVKELKAWKAKIEAAKASGDDEEAVKLIWEMDLNSFQKRQVDKVRGRDPRLDAERKARLELEQRLAEKEAKETEARETEAAERERYQHKLSITHELSQHSDPVIAELATVTEFIEGLKLPGVFDAQADSFDGEDYITAEEAVERVLPQWRKVYAALGKFLGDRDAVNPANVTDRSSSSSAKPPAQAGKKKAIAQGKAAEASPTTGRVDEVALKQRYAQRLASSED